MKPKLIVLAAALFALPACTNSAPEAGSRPDWVTGAWESGDARLLLESDGSYSTLGTDLWDEAGTWHVSGSSLVMQSRFESRPTSMTLEPVVGCSLIKLDDYWLARPNNPATDCPNPEPALTDSERCMAGAYSRHEDHSVHRDWTQNDSIDTDDFRVTLASEHFYEMTVEHFDTDGYVSHSGSGFVMGRWNLGDDGRVHLVPLAYSNVTVPSEQTVVVTTQGATRSFDGDSYAFIGGCE